MGSTGASDPNARTAPDASSDNVERWNSELKTLGAALINLPIACSQAQQEAAERAQQEAVKAEVNAQQQAEHQQKKAAESVETKMHRQPG